MPTAAARPPILIRNGYVIPGANRTHLDRADIFFSQESRRVLGPVFDSARSSII